MTEAHRSDNGTRPSRRTVLLAFGATAVSAAVGVHCGSALGRVHRQESAPAQLAQSPVPLQVPAQVSLSAEPPPRLVALESQVTSSSATIVTAPPATELAVAFALAQRGARYVWGATGPNAFDCSGLTLRAYQAAGVHLPRTAREQAGVGTRIPVSAGFDVLAPGDLVFWAYRPSNLSTVHHVAIYLGNHQIVHAPQAGDVVKVDTIWPSGYAGAVRVA